MTTSTLPPLHSTTPDPTLRAAITWALLDAGFSRPDADLWANNWLGTPDPGLVLDEASTHDDHGIEIRQAIEWHRHGFQAFEATSLYDSKWSPQQAATVRDLCDDPSEFHEWVATGITAARVTNYLHAEVSVDEFAALDVDEVDLDAVLATMAALLRD